MWVIPQSYGIIIHPANFQTCFKQITFPKHGVSDSPEKRTYSYR